MKRTVTRIALVLTALAGMTLLGAEEEWQTTFDENRTDLVTTGRNPYFILEPGHELVLAGMDDGVSVELVIRVLDERKTVDGVETRVVEERESVAGKLVEVSRNYFAISKRTSNVYYFGEETTLFGKDGAGRRGEDSWAAGANGASFGMIMPGAPRVGMKYHQEHAPGTAMDRAEVVSVTEEVKVPAGKFDGCLRVRESNPLDSDEREYKLYAPGVGLLVDENLKLVRYSPT
jgi:hypothetical protein